MYNTTPYGVRRAHSFDSYDNLDKWQAIREHRMQFLSTRAKFDNTLPPTEPPPPPPRHASKFRMSSSSSSTSCQVSPVSQLIQNFTEELKSMSTNDKTSENLVFQDKDQNDGQFLPVTKNINSQSNFTGKKTTHNLRQFKMDQNDFEQYKFRTLESPGSEVFQDKDRKDGQFLPVTKNINSQSNFTDKTTTHNVRQLKTDQNDFEHYRFRTLESPGSVLHVTQSWQKYRLEQSAERNKVKSLPVPIVHQKSRYGEVANEPPALRKRVDELGYSEPTFFQDINVNRRTLQNVTNSTSFSGGSAGVTSTTEPHSFDPWKENRSLSSAPILRRPSEFKATPNSKFTMQTTLHGHDSLDSSLPKNVTYQRTLFHKAAEKPKHNTQEDRRLYLESTLKMFTDDLPQEEKMDFTSMSACNDNSNDSVSAKPRRVSTGSLHEPTNWRSHTKIPVRTLVQKFSNVESKSSQKM